MCKLRIFVAVLSLLLLVPPAAVMAGDSTATLICDEGPRVVWEGEVTDAEGDPLPPGEHTVEYCYYEDAAQTTLIGCCTTTVIVQAVPPDSATGSGTTTVAKAALAYPDPWEDTALAPGTYATANWSPVALAFSAPSGGTAASTVSYVFTHFVWLEVSYRGRPLAPMMQIGFLPRAGVRPLEQRLRDLEAKVNLLMSERE